MGKHHPCCAEIPSEPRKFVARIPDPDNEVGTTGGKSRCDFFQGGVNEGNPSVCAASMQRAIDHQVAGCVQFAWNGREDRGVEDKHQLDGFRIREGGSQCGVIVKPQVPAQPHQGAGLCFRRWRG